MFILAWTAPVIKGEMCNVHKSRNQRNSETFA